MELSRINKPRTSITDRKLPSYTKEEEIFNTVTHIIGGVFGIAVLVLCTVFSALHSNISGIVSGIIYGFSMITVYTVSSVYHGLDAERACTAKKIMQIIDHCDIYGLIIGTYAPVVLTYFRKEHPLAAWLSFGTVCIFSVIGIIFTSVDFKKYAVISYGAYFVAGWSILLNMYLLFKTYSPEFVILLIAGGAVYTSGMIFYVLEKKNFKYGHSIFHIFILCGSVIQFIPIFKYCI